MLVVSGPGTGKSYLFLDRIASWLKAHAGQTILVTTFVRKLLADLEVRIAATTAKEELARIQLSTIHKLARSIVERNSGSSKRRLGRHVRMITGEWSPIVWADVMEFHRESDRHDYSWDKLTRQFFDDSPAADGEWPRIQETYSRLTSFYNAVNFCDAIVIARQALEENNALSTDDLFIIDEYQDLNRSEENLIRAVSKKARAVLFVGDDDQILYEGLKNGRPELIRALHADTDVVKAMLPFARRGNFHITRAAASFIQSERDAGAIEKIYLPMKDGAGDDPPIQVVACSSPGTAVAYVAWFLNTHKAEIENRMKELEDGKSNESYLLILTPDREASFLGDAAKLQLQTLLHPYKRSDSTEPSDYVRVLEYYEVAKSPHGNFAVRKLLHYHGTKPSEMHELLVAALDSGKDLCDLNAERITAAFAIAEKVRNILDSTGAPKEKVAALVAAGVRVKHGEELEAQLAKRHLETVEKQLEDAEEKEAETAGRGLARLSAAEQMTIVSSKGLTAEHVIVLGCDDVNMNYVTKNAFFVALTRARKEVHFVCSLKTGGASAPHRWLHRLLGNHVHYVWYNKTGNMVKELNGWNGFSGRIEFMKKVMGKRGGT